MTQQTKSILIVAIILLIYGYLCRMVGLNFFWESKMIGWILLFLALLFYWIDLSKRRRQLGKKTIWVTIGISILFLFLLIAPVAIVLLKTSKAYDTAVEYLRSDPKIREEVGNVKGFGLIPAGSVETTTINGVESGYATFQIIVRGSRKYKDVIIDLQEAPGKYWTVTYVR